MPLLVPCALKCVVGSAAMTLKLKRIIISQFMDGRSLRAIWMDMSDAFAEFQVHEVLRSYIKGEFTLPRKRGKR